MTSRPGLGAFSFQKIIETLLALFLLAFIAFAFLRALPGGPFDEETPMNPLVRESLQRYWSLDQPFFIQFLIYLKSIARGDFGSSMAQTGRTVVDVLAAGVAQTLALNAIAILTAYAGAFITSLLGTLKSGTWIAQVIEILNVLAISMPSLFLGPILIYFFAFYLNLLPAAFLTTPEHYILPVMTLALRPWAQMNLLLTNSLRDNLRLDYVRTARAKGLSRMRVVLGHALKNSIMPILSLSGPLIVGLISGSFVVEILFAIPGLGQQFVESLNLRDYPVVMALVLCYGAGLILLTNVFDFLAHALDPRLTGQR
ncbi:MAG: ABC transporter permease [Bdellovibrionaceae bacterium]|nr:ABC transporter permease [Pseudobdellovibrionaceae bacterium]